MDAIRRILRLAGAVLAALVGVWFGAVRALPEVKRRKAQRRR